MLRAVFPNPDARIFPGFFVSVRIAGEILKDALVVEERAIGTDLGGKFIYVVGDDNVFPAHDGANGCALWQREFFHRTADYPGRMLVAQGHGLDGFRRASAQ